MGVSIEGHNLKLFREAAGYTSAQAFADAIGIETSTITRLENGKRQSMRDHTRARVAEGLGIAPLALTERPLTPTEAAALLGKSPPPPRHPSPSLIELLADRAEKLQADLDEVQREIALLRAAINGAQGAG
jgi:transcriptional regulator with XRE-family HTH domain